MKLTLTSWTKKKLLPKQLRELKPKRSVSWQRLPQRLKERRLRLLLRRLMRKVTLMMTGRKQQPTPRTMLKIAGMLILKKKGRRLPPKRLVLQMANPNQQACPRGPRKTQSQSQTWKNHQKMKRYLRHSKQQP